MGRRSLFANNYGYTTTYSFRNGRHAVHHHHDRSLHTLGLHPLRVPDERFNRRRYSRSVHKVLTTAITAACRSRHSQATTDETLDKAGILLDRLHADLRLVREEHKQLVLLVVLARHQDRQVVAAAKTGEMGGQGTVIASTQRPSTLRPGPLFTLVI